MTGAYRVQPPAQCTDSDRRDFEGLVRRGFDGSDDGLVERMRTAERLGFHRTDTGILTGIAGLKVPAPRYLGAVFAKAEAAVAPSGFRFELGWAFVLPRYRGRGIGMELCKKLLEHAGGHGVVAMTRPTNGAMIGILRAQGFQETGTPYPRRDETLLLFVRPGAAPGGAPATD